jgi:serine/threonine protein phosphatase PrpC
MKGGPAPRQMLIPSFLLVVAWLLLLLIALHLIRLRRRRRGNRETQLGATRLRLQAASQHSEQQAILLAQRRSSFQNAEESYQHPRVGLPSISSGTSAASTQEESQETGKPHVNELPRLALNAVTAHIAQPVSSLDHLVKELHQNTSHGDASIHSFRIAQTPMVETDQDGIVLDGWSLCHPGIQRSLEPLEDFLLVASGLQAQVASQVPFALFILADGSLVSSQDDPKDPEVSLSRSAAHWFSETVLPALYSGDSLEPQAVLSLLTEGMRKANRCLHQYNQREQTNEMVTMTALLILGTEAYTANVGDNRAYFYRLKRSRHATDEGLFQITNDHSSTAIQLEQGTLTPDDLFQLPKSDHVYRALGQQAVLNAVDVFSITLSAGDVLLLCSDGLWKVVREEALLHIVERLLQPPISSPALLCPALVQAALEAGGHDHTSIMVARARVIQ